MPEISLSDDIGNFLEIPNIYEDLEIPFSNWLAAINTLQSIDQLNGGNGSLSKIKNKKILDIGCGGTDTADTAFIFEQEALPAFALAASYYGAKVTGIDIGKQTHGTEEFYNHKRLDLTDMAKKGDQLKRSVGDNFDIVVARRLINPGSPSEELKKSLNKNSLNLSDFSDWLEEQMKDLTKRNGYYTDRDDKFIKK